MIKNSARRLLERLLGATDYRLVSRGESQERASFADHLSTLLRALEVDCVFDIGANRGGFREFLRAEVGYEGLILSFEPVSRLADVLVAASRSDPSWHVFRIAIGDAAGVMPIKVTKNDQLSSFLDPSSTGTAHFSEMSSVSYVEDATIQTLAGVYPGLQQEHGFERPYLKIDTQGFDLKVLRGAGEHLARFPAMQTELSIIPLYDGQPSYVEVLELLNREGFSISGMYPVVRDAFFKVIEFDCVLVRGPAAI